MGPAKRGPDLVGAPVWAPDTGGKPKKKKEHFPPKIEEKKKQKFCGIWI